MFKKLFRACSGKQDEVQADCGAAPACIHTKKYGPKVEYDTPEWREAGAHIWESLDYSKDMYTQHTRSVCRNTSRKLSDLPPEPTPIVVDPNWKPLIWWRETPAQTIERVMKEAELAEQLKKEQQALEAKQRKAQEEAEGKAQQDPAAAAAAPASPAAAAPAAAAAAPEGQEGACEQSDHAASEDQKPAAPQEDLRPFLAAPSESRLTPEQLRKSSKSMTQQAALLQQQLRAPSKTLDQQAQQPEVAC